MHSVEKYVQIDYLDEKHLVPVLLYVSYLSNLDQDATELYELYKKLTISETRIEQV